MNILLGFLFMGILALIFIGFPIFFFARYFYLHTKNVTEQINDDENNPKNYHKDSYGYFNVQGHKFWDPVQESLNFERMKRDNDKLMTKYDKIKDRKSIRKKKFWFWILGAVLSLYFIWFGIVSFEHEGSESLIAIFFGFVVIFIPIGIYKTSFFSLKKDLIKFLYAEQMNWLYSPNIDYSKIEKLNNSLKNYFAKGNSGNHIEDQFWGSLNGKYFQLGLYQYQITTGSGKNRHTQTYHNTYVAIKTDKNLDLEFILRPESEKGWFKKDIETESIDFNKAFAIDYFLQSDNNELLATKHLNPKVITELVDLQKKYGKFTIFFKKGYLLFLFPNPLIKGTKTNFFKSPEVAKEDIDSINYSITQFINLSEELIKAIR
ncbi:MAG: DUF3137 domain-containing protein [Nanoarchaeota archaeon]